MHTDSALVADALRRRPGAVRALVTHIEPTLRFQIGRVLLADARGFGARNLAAEIDDHVQDVLLILFRNHGKALRDWSGEASLRTYVGRIAQRCAAGTLRYRSSHPWYQLPTEHDTIARALRTEADALDTLASDQILQLALSGTMDTLSPQGQRVAKHILRDRQTPKQVAALTGMSLDAVYQWRSRLQRALKKRVLDLLSEGDSLEAT